MLRLQKHEGENLSFIIYSLCTLSRTSNEAFPTALEAMHAYTPSSFSVTLVITSDCPFTISVNLFDGSRLTHL